MSPLFEQPLKKKSRVKAHHLQLLDLSVKRLIASLVGIKVKSAICFNSSQIASLGVSASTLSHNLIYPLTSKKSPKHQFFPAKSLKNDFWCLMGLVLYIFLNLKCATFPGPSQTWDQAYAPFESWRPGVLLGFSFRIHCWLISTDLQKSPLYPIGKAPTNGGKKIIFETTTQFWLRRTTTTFQETYSHPSPYHIPHPISRLERLIGCFPKDTSLLFSG